MIGCNCSCAGDGGLVAALRSGARDAERGGQAAELARVVAKHDIKARRLLWPAFRSPYMISVPVHAVMSRVPCSGTPTSGH